ncbi:ATP-binding protein [Fulvivirgaceae bacterium BMA12]|uniref:ATP-binding protein n=1 Tax=Agaribacillus aureus TaxID=3051825 RepID=A0ABT8LHK3_9BACT|nr:ATP-binding protein [Fulvivirgaceae bacterium BMA12]
MSRLQAIENALSAINETVFQELCDSFLALRNTNYSALSRVGSQSGKQKSTKGTPDTFLLLPSGKYIFVEHSTNISAGLSKLKDDIDKCLDSEKTGIPLSQIAEIILCINFNLKSNETQELVSLLKDTRIVLTIYTLDSLSIELHLNHRDLTHQYLELPLDTGQIVSIEKFIDEYNRASGGISTPIDNTFLYREQEIKELKEGIHSNDFIILTGAPGVGKTKLALEGIKSFLTENLEFGAYCVSYKSHTLLDDLFQYLSSDKDYILFVDDANRIDAFNQITGFYKASRMGKLKVIITVRDYAFQEIGILCQEFAPKRMDIVKFTDEQIIKIVSAEPFKTNQYYHRQITHIADGNPRIAIMSALLANEKMDIYALNDVSDLFEKYFSAFVKDKGEFAKNLNIKCLGLIAFFYTIPYKNKEIVSSILAHFEINYPSFIDVIDKLDKLELVEIQFEHVKIPEQNLSTYFFYKAFIKDRLLSFETLLRNYYESNKDRFKDCVFPANNTFGAKNVMDKLQPFLRNYWKFVQNDEEKGFNFLSTFWLYLSDETFEFIYNLVEKLPESNSENYEVAYENNAFSYNRNNIIDLIENFFRFQKKELKDAIQLAFEYVRKKPENLPELIYAIRGNLIFDEDDEPHRFERQSNLFKILLDGLHKKNTLYTKAFYELSKTFLKYQHDHTKVGRHHSFYMYQYQLPNNQFIQKFRANIWNAVNENYSTYPDESFSLLEDYGANPDVIEGIMEFDIPFVLDIIENHFTIESFDHCKYVQDQVRWFKRNSMSHPSFESLIHSFRNSTYETYLKIDWDRLRDREQYEFEDYREYERLKEEEIRTSFVLKNGEEVDDFLKAFFFLKEKAKNEWNYNNSLDFVVDENYKHNPKIGLVLLSKITEEDNKLNYIPRAIFRNHLKTDVAAKEIWLVLQKRDFNLKPHWELSFYDYLDEVLLDKKYVSTLIDTISSMQGSSTIHFHRLQRFLSVEPNLFKIILRKIVERNDKGAKLRVWMDFFSTHFVNLGNDVDLIKKAYIQQNRIQNHFDNEGKGLLNILKKAPQFLIEYIDNLLSDGHRRVGGNRRLGFIWKVADIESTLVDVFELVIKKKPYFGILDHFCNSFFRNIPEGLDKKAKEFLIEYVKQNHNDHEKMNVIVDIARHSMKDIFDDILLLFVSLNQDVEVFSKIWWRGNGGSYSGDVIIGDMEAADWRNILSIVEKSDIGIKLIPIKTFINEKVQSALRRGDWERKRRFLERY